jgi:hypothetical protein
MVFYHMIEFLDLAFRSFDNRDLATIIWLIIILIIFFVAKDPRNAFYNVIKAFFQPQLFRITLLSIIYFEILLILLLNFGLWNITLFKDSIYWFLGFFIVNIFNSTKISSNPEILKGFITKNFKLFVLFEFFTNFYTLDLWLELLLLPILAFLGIMLAMIEVYPDRISNTKIAKAIINIPILVIVSIYFFNSISIVFDQMNTFLTLTTLKKLLLPIILIILSIPFLYLLSLYSLYESFFLRLKYLYHNDIKLQYYAKWQIFSKCLFNMTRLNKISSSINRAGIKDVNDFDIYIRNY